MSSMHSGTSRLERGVIRQRISVLDYSKALNLLKLPVGEKWYTLELKAHRLVLHRTTLGVDTVMVGPEYVAGKGPNETASALIGELYTCSTGAGHLFIHTDGCCSEFLNWVVSNLYDKLVQWRWFHHITWCVFIKGHPYNLCMQRHAPWTVLCTMLIIIMVSTTWLA